MNKTLIATLIVCVHAAGWAQSAAPHPADKPKPSVSALCDSCGIVQQVHQEKRKGKGGAVGIVGGAVAGGLLGNQIGKGTGNTVATVGGAVAGGFVGNEVQKQVTSTKVWVTKVKMKDGSIRSFEQEAQPGWAVGQHVKVRENKTLARL